MRILNLIPSVDPARGGSIEAVRVLQKPVEARGHRWEIASLDAPDAECVRNCFAKTYALGPARGFYAYSPSFHRDLAVILRDFDVAVIHGIWQYHAFGGWRALQQTPLPYAVYPHGMLDPYFRRAFPLKHLKKWLVWPWSEYRILKGAGAVCFTGESEKLLARESFWLYQAKERVVGLGTSAPTENADAARAAFLAQFPAQQNRRFLLYIARIAPKKGLDLLLEAFAALFAENKLPPDLDLVIAGPDSDGWRAQLEAKFIAPELEKRIHWTGMIGGEVKWGAFHACEAFVLPSHQENFGIAVAEALAREIPVLISDQVNIWREIESENAGIVAPDTLVGTRKLLESWLALSNAERKTMRQNAKRCFESHFSIDGAGEKLVACLEEIRGKNSPQRRGDAEKSRKAL